MDRDWLAPDIGDCEWGLNEMLGLNPQLLDAVTGIDPSAIPIRDLCVYSTIYENDIFTPKGWEFWFMLQSSDSEQPGTSIYANLFWSLKKSAELICFSTAEHFDFTCDS